MEDNGKLDLFFAPETPDEKRRYVACVQAVIDDCREHLMGIMTRDEWAEYVAMRHEIERGEIVKRNEAYLRKKGEAIDKAALERKK